MISIIVPVHNEAQHLDDFFHSAICQTVADWEVVIVDDGSTDETRQIATDWASKEPRIRVAETSGKIGKVAAFNRAYAECTGDAICHVGGDDLLPTNSVELRRDSLADGPDRTVSFGKFRFTNSEGEPVGTAYPHGNFGSQSSAGATYSRDLANLIFPIPTDLPSEDIWLGNAARACSSEIRHITDVVSHYRQHDMNSNPRNKEFADMTHSISQRMRAYRSLLDSDLPIPPQFRQQFQKRIETEELRINGSTLAILTRSGTRPIDRLALASMSRPSLWRLRQRAGRFASGWRGR